MGSLAAASWRSVPGPTSNRNTCLPSTTAVAGPEASGLGLGIPVPSKTTEAVSEAGTVERRRLGQGRRADPLAYGDDPSRSPAKRPTSRDIVRQ